MGKKYDVNIWRLVQKYSTTDSVNIIPENKSYFCSELIASLYKFLGLLPAEICSANYWPGSFSTETGIRLLNGARLEKEQLVDFSS